MGDPCSPILGELFFYDLEKEILDKFDIEIPFYGRYVDDTFLIIPKNKIKFVLDTFNSYHERIKFTIEIEKDNKLNFLDMHLIRNNSEGSIISNWYRKKTYSGRLLNYLSDHPKHHKAGVIKSLVDKAIKLSHPKFHNNNLKYLKEILFLNNYPKKFVNYQIKNRVEYINLRDNRTADNIKIDNINRNKKTFLLPSNTNLSNNMHNFIKK